MSEQPATPSGVPAWDVADRIRKALRHASISVQELADYLEVSRASVSNWINGHVDPSAQTLRLIALRCGVSYPWLRFGDTGPASPDPGTSSKVRKGAKSAAIWPPRWHNERSPERSPIAPAARVAPLARPVAA